MNEFDELRPEWYHRETPAAALGRYRYGLMESLEDADDGLSLEAMYRRAILDLVTLLERTDAAGEQHGEVLRKVVPEAGGYSSEELGLAEWCRQLRMAPLRLLNNSVISLPELGNDGVSELFRLALDDETHHVIHRGVEAVSDEHGCESALTCPARYLKSVMFRECQLLYLSIFSHDRPAEYPGLVNDMSLVTHLRDEMDKYGLVSPQEFRVYQQQMEGDAKAFYEELRFPRSLL